MLVHIPTNTFFTVIGKTGTQHWFHMKNLKPIWKTIIMRLKNLVFSGMRLTYFMPPYEWCNREIVDWSRKLGLHVINFTPGTGTNADYTSPLMKNYKSSEEIWCKAENFRSIRSATSEWCNFAYSSGNRSGKKRQIL